MIANPEPDADFTEAGRTKTVTLSAAEVEAGAVAPLLRMFQCQLDLRALREQRIQVTDADGVRHGAVEAASPRVVDLVRAGRGHSDWPTGTGARQPVPSRRSAQPAR